ncbi:MAG: hypothetical protein HYZ42_11975, partial [Bacteroidetes bacterium]|nr:hypothetical protein [Bacteroidota bacterium]
TSGRERKLSHHAGSGGCLFHNGSSGTHEVVNKTGIESLNFTVYSIKVTIPDTICLTPAEGGISATGSQDAMPFPDNGQGTFLWTAESNNITINNETSRNATFTLNDVNSVGSVSVTFTIEGVTYKTTAIVKSCKCSCKPITNGVSFGPLAFTFNVNPDQTAPDGGFCSYNVSDATLGNLKLVDFVTKESSFENVSLSFKKNCETGEYKDVKISWHGLVNVGTIYKIDAAITSLVMGYDFEANRITGTVGLKASLNKDVDLSTKGYIMLREGVNGDFKFDYQAGSDAFSGKFNFEGVSGINIDIVKDAKNIAQFKDGSLTAEGKLSGNLSALVGATYKSNTFTIEMVALTLGFNWDLRENNFDLTSGNGKVKAKDIKAVKGEFALTLDFNQDNCSATVEASDVTAFGMTLDEFNLSALFTYEFDMVELDGSLKAKHNSFDAKVGISTFHVENASLTKFEGDGSVNYNKFKFNLKELAYTSTPSQLTISADAEIDLAIKATLGVDKFIINEEGIITIGKIEGSVVKYPIDASFKASFEASRFKGTFSAKFASAGPIEGKVDIGSTESCSFGYFELGVGGLNLPLGQSGLKITQLGGKFGFNYSVVAGDASCGTYVFGGKLGVADIGNVCEVVSDVSIELGGNKFALILDGNVNVLRNNSFFTANLKATYKLPENTLDGSFKTDLKVPSSGWVLQSENVGFDFAVGNGSWKVDGKNMGGSMFKGFIALSDGTIYMSSSDGTSLTGNIKGTAKIGHQYGSSVAFWGNTFSANVYLSMNSTIDAGINQTGLNGSFGVKMNAGGNVSYELFIGRGGSVAVNALANGNMSYDGSNVNVNGNMHVDLPFSISYPTCPFGWAWDSNCWASLDAIDFGVNISL